MPKTLPLLYRPEEMIIRYGPPKRLKYLMLGRGYMGRGSKKDSGRSSPIAPTLPLPSLRLLSRAPSTTFQGPGTHILHWGRHAKEIPAAVGYGRGSKSNSGRPSPLAPTHKRLPAAGALSRLVSYACLAPNNHPKLTQINK